MQAGICNPGPGFATGILLHVSPFWTKAGTMPPVTDKKMAQPYHLYT